MKYNQVTLIGRLTDDPKISTVKSGKDDKVVSNFRLAVSRDFKKDGKDVADFFPVTFWEKTAELIGKWLKKGSLVLVVGRVYIEKREVDVSGQKMTHYYVEVIGDRFQALDKLDKAS